MQLLENIEPVLQIIALILGMALTAISFLVQWENWKLRRLEAQAHEKQDDDSDDQG